MEAVETKGQQKMKDLLEEGSSTSNSVRESTDDLKNSETDSLSQPTTSAANGMSVFSDSRSAESAEEEDSALIQSSDHPPSSSKTGAAPDFTDKILLDPNGIFIPPRMFCHLESDLLQQLGILQAVRNKKFYYKIREELIRRGKNAGLKMFDISREIAVPGYLREIRAFWENYSDESENDYEFAFVRVVSFLFWALANICQITDVGRLDVEKLMVCYNRRWGETSTARKHFDIYMRHILFKLQDLVAVRSWCGVLREKTVFDLATSRAPYLTVIDLGTMASVGPFGAWNIEHLLRKLTNIEDFTWLNCDSQKLTHLASWNTLKRLVLHVTQYNKLHLDRFFSRFGCDNDQKPWEIMNTRKFLEPSKNVACLSYVVFSIAHSIFPPPSHFKIVWDKDFGDEVNVGCEDWDVPRAVFMADTVILNLPPEIYRKDLINLGRRKKFSVGLPKEICVNINPNRTPFGSVVQLLKKCIRERKQNGQRLDVDELEIHAMFDHYREERIYDICDLALRATRGPQKLRLHFTTAGRNLKKEYHWPRYVPEDILPGIHLTVFELTLDCVTFRVPQGILDFVTLTVREFYITMSGLPHGLYRVTSAVMRLFRCLMNRAYHLRTVVFRTNTPYFFEFFETLSSVSAKAALCHPHLKLQTLGIICCCAPKEEMRHISSDRIYNAIKSIDPTLQRRLKKLILDGRIWGTLSAEHLASLRELLPTCSFDAELAPDDCKELKDRDNFNELFESSFFENSDGSDEDRIFSRVSMESDGSESELLDDGEDVLLRSDYSDAGEEAGIPDVAEMFTMKLKKNDTSRKLQQCAISSQCRNKMEFGKTTSKQLPRKKGKISPRKRKMNEESGTSSDEEWRPGPSWKKKV